MKTEVPPGKYVLAVSGGVDSMVLLDLLSKNPGIQLIVAHFNHGIRPDSHLDEKLVKRRAGELGLPFVAGQGGLSPNASEAAARTARYGFLRQIKEKHSADAIITAHHQDDLIETAVINLLRGTGRRGLSAILENKEVKRPLLGYQKRQILSYAKKNRLAWREDITNAEDKYLRNYVRRRLLTDLTGAQRKEILNNIAKIAEQNIQIDEQIAKISQIIARDGQINRAGFSSLPVSLGNELIVYWLRSGRMSQYDQKTVNRLSIALKTAKNGSVYPAQGDVRLLIGEKTARFSSTL